MMTALESPPFQALLVALVVTLAVVTGGHALLTKRDPRAAWGWIAVCVVFPLAGPLLYYWFGINRIRIRARRMVGSEGKRGIVSGRPHPPSPRVAGVAEAEILELVRIGEAMSGRSLVAGNKVELLVNGEEAYPAMLAAIDRAKQSVCLASYIFDAGAAGQQFVGALVAAHERGVEVRVLVDGVADLYYRPSAARMLQQRGVPVARFLPPRLFPPMLHVNLRNHRKLLSIDGEVAFTGGMNISDRHYVHERGTSGTADLQFRVTGPVVEQLEQAFADDWRFAFGKRMKMAATSQRHVGTAMCRVITDGPNLDMAALIMVLLGALATAHKRVLIMTPYFLPPVELIGALQSAALRGVEVCVVLPEKSNQRPVDWATRALLWQLLQHHVRVFYAPPPFAHTKLFVVDDYYAQIGSANIDERSLRLNFELVLEVFDQGFVGELVAHFEAARARSREACLAELHARSLPVRLRDALFWLFSVYL
jgi:cardiolipin synthase